MRESAVMGRRMLHLAPIGTMSTVFPSQPSTRYPSSVAGASLGLMEYLADCEPATGNPTILALSVSSNIKNVADGSNVTLSIRWESHDASLRSAVELPRMSLTGYLERVIPQHDQDVMALCYVKAHPDSVLWIPGSRIHDSYWTRLVVKEVYWVGGFGDRAFIGWIPQDVWGGVTEDEIEKCRLPGESPAFLGRNSPKLEM
jgi:hypothetical protein